MAAFQRHLWYLGDELVVLSLFSKNVPHEEKNYIARTLVENMNQREVSNRTRNFTRYNEDLGNVRNMQLHDFDSPRSIFLLSTLNIDTAFLLHDANQWNDRLDYKHAQKIIKKLLICVNYAAERELQYGAKLIDEQKVRTEARLQNAIVKIEKN